MHNTLLPEDYTEPVCPFCTSMYDDEPTVKSIPVLRVLDKLDEYLNKNDYSGAERHLTYWYKDALDSRDYRGALTVANELMGLTRKLARKESAYSYADDALLLIQKAELDNSVTAGTTYLNVATVYKAFGEPQKAVMLYERALSLYNIYLADSDPRMAGLYNNYALALTDIGRYADARDSYRRAIAVNALNPGSELDTAITYLNLADLACLEHGEGAEEIAIYLSRAKDIFTSQNVQKDGYYAFVAEKCAPTFERFGECDFAEMLKTESARIYNLNAKR